ncbi:MAG: hypothetical protein FWH14_01625 [Oscillospiraceae bacterium]|nr:hypothetical protein [Oscillospiraceae bacterium]
MDIVVHYPKTTDNIKELEKRIATIHAQAVTLHIEKLSCPKEQKLKLYDAIKEAHHLVR